jgi:copper chaperone CopZ
MESATIAPRTLQIDGMTGDACVKKVTDSLKNVPGVTHPTVQLGAATITSDEAGCKSACAAIGTAGFKAHEDKRHHDAGGTTHATPSTRAEHKPAQQNPASPAVQTVAAAKPAVAAH